MYEVEVKARVRSAAAVVEDLRRRGETVPEPRSQHDLVFATSMDDVLNPRPGIRIARIRTEGGVSTLNLKQHRTNELDVIEFETRVSDSTATEQILFALGMRMVVRVKKKRYSCAFHGTTVCIDIVEGLGDFVEIESLYSRPPHPSAQTELAARLRDLLGPSPFEQVHWGYDRLLLSQSSIPTERTFRERPDSPSSMSAKPGGG